MKKYLYHSIIIEFWLKYGMGVKKLRMGCRPTNIFKFADEEDKTRGKYYQNTDTMIFAIRASVTVIMS